MGATRRSCSRLCTEVTVLKLLGTMVANVDDDRVQKSSGKQGISARGGTARKRQRPEAFVGCAHAQTTPIFVPWARFVPCEQCVYVSCMRGSDERRAAATRPRLPPDPPEKEAGGVREDRWPRATTHTARALRWTSNSAGSSPGGGEQLQPHARDTSANRSSCLSLCR